MSRKVVLVNVKSCVRGYRVKSVQKVRLFSLLLRMGCYVGMAGVFVLPLIDWIYGGLWIQGFKEEQWHVGFSSMPIDSIEPIPLFIKVVGFTADLIHYAFLFAMFFCFSKLFNLFEKPYFFTKNHIHYLRLAGSFLFLSQIFQPLYLLLRKYLWALPDQKIVISISSLIDFQIFIVAGVVFLFSYIIEGVISIEEDYKLTV